MPDPLPPIKGVIVRFVDGDRMAVDAVLRDQRRQLLEAFARPTTGDWTLVRRLSTGAYLYHLERPGPAARVRELADSLRVAVPEVLASTPDEWRMTTSMAADPQNALGGANFDDGWNLGAGDPGPGIRAQPAWFQATGAGVVVAVLDNGVVPVPQMTSRSLPGYDMVADASMSGDGDGRDAHPFDPGLALMECLSRPGARWQGTRVQGLIATGPAHRPAATVAPEAKVLTVRVMSHCLGRVSDLVDGIAWAAGEPVPDAPPNRHPAQIINLSLGAPGVCTYEERLVIDRARARGVTVVAAAGNEGSNVRGFAPANCPGAVAVAASDGRERRASYSNFGGWIATAAPGGDPGHPLGRQILTLSGSPRYPAVGHAWEFASGTALAAAHVSGVAALMKSMRPLATPQDIESILRRSGRAPFESCEGCGAGLLDAYKALQNVKGVPLSGPLAPVPLFRHPFHPTHYVAPTWVKGDAAAEATPLYFDVPPGRLGSAILESAPGVVLTGFRLLPVRRHQQERVALSVIGNGATGGLSRGVWFNDTEQTVTLLFEVRATQAGPIPYTLRLNW